MEVITFQKLISDVLKYNAEEVEPITKAFRYAERMHLNQKRDSKENYINHPLAVAYTLSEMRADRNTICAALLHDVLEDTKVTKADLAAEFNEEIVKLVDGVTKLKKMKFSSKSEASDANTRKILTSIKKDPRILIIKLADRLHNMQTLAYKDEEKQQEVAVETLELYVPLAHYIGAYRIKSSLEDLAFFYLRPSKYREISSQISNITEINEASVYDMLMHLSKALKKEKINRDIKMRSKNIYGVYKELNEGHKIEDIHDLLTLKIMVDDLKSCYQTLGIVHHEYPPVNHYFKDYIALPKTNMYQSLHTTVFSPDERLVQTQIRTFAMDKVASFGLTAYWDLNKGLAKKVMHDKLNEKSQFFKALNEINTLIEDNQEFVNSIKGEFFGENVYVYSSKGDIIQLPQGATPIDFAYRLDPEKAEKMLLAIVNDQTVDLAYELQDNDLVRIITDSGVEGPEIAWLEKAKTPSARIKIKEFNQRKK